MTVCSIALFTPEECEDLLALFPQLTPARVNGRIAARQSKTAFLASETPLVQRICEAMIEVNRDSFSFDLEGVEAPQLACYDTGDFYDHHLDIGHNVASARRKLSASLQLTDPTTYEGGDLEIWGNDTVNRNQGALIVFPSYLLHRVTPVTRGTRHSLVIWAIGKPFR